MGGDFSLRNSFTKNLRETTFTTITADLPMRLKQIKLEVPSRLKSLFARLWLARLSSDLTPCPPAAIALVWCVARATDEVQNCDSTRLITFWEGRFLPIIKSQLLGHLFVSFEVNFLQDPPSLQTRGRKWLFLGVERFPVEATQKHAFSTHHKSWVTEQREQC